MPKLMESRSSDGFEPSGEINVTPFIDVMLVLLLVFMIAAPMSTVNVPVELPTSSEKARPAEPQPVIVSVKSDLSLYLGDTPVTEQSLAGELRKQGATESTTIYLHVDKRVSYGDLVGVLDKLRQAHFTQVALVGLEGAT